MEAQEIPSAGRVLALDWGERRIGIALSDELQLFSSPLATVTRQLTTDPNATLYEALPCNDIDHLHVTSHVRSG